MHGKDASEHFVDIPGLADFIRSAQGNRLSVGSGAGSTAYAVYVNFRFRRQVIVDDELDVLDVDAAGPRCP